MFTRLSVPLSQQNKPMSQWTNAEWEEWEAKETAILDAEEFDSTAELIDAAYEYMDEIYACESPSFDDLGWTDEDEAALEEWEIKRRERIAERNEY